MENKRNVKHSGAVAMQQEGDFLPPKPPLIDAASVFYI